MSAKKTRKLNTFQLVLSSMFLALALILPFFTGQIQQIGNALCPMHLPIILCGFFCGPWYGLLIGFIAPLLRFSLFGAPIIMPIGVAMAFELATYGFVAGILYKYLPNKKIFIYVALIVSMILGRCVWGIARVILYGVYDYSFGWKAFFAGAFLNAIPGIVIQILFIPLIVMSVNKSMPNLRNRVLVRQ